MTRDAADYQLGTVPKRLRRRAGAIVNLAFLGLGLAFLVVVAVLEGVRPDGATWLVLAGGAAALVLVLALAVRTLSPADREVLAAAQRRVLPPLPPPEHGDDLRVPLRPGPVWRRRLAGDPDACVLVADAEGLAIPGWLLHAPPRGLDRFAPLRVAWRDIERFRVQADSEGPDLYEIRCAVPGSPDARWRVRRHEITDELALLHHVRSVGGLPIELEASVPPGP